MANRRFLTFPIAVVSALSACSGGSGPTGTGGRSSGGAAGAATGGGGSSSGGVGNGGSGGVTAGTGGAARGGAGGASGDGAGEAGEAGEAGSGAAGSSTCLYPESAALTSASVPAGYCAYTWASELGAPRGIVVDANGDVLVIDTETIVLLYDDDGNGVSDAGERVLLRMQSGLNHGIAIDRGYLYASTQTTVYRWPHAANRQPLGDPQEVVTGIPSDGHITRTLQFDTQGRLYVSIGSNENVDDNSDRARVIRYSPGVLGSSSTFAQGELFADGLRNEVGLTLDGEGRIWGVENGRDNLQRPDLGTDIHQDNPGEELNLFLEENAGRFYGYPYCWSEFDLPDTGSGPGTQWADPNNTTHDDAWCKSASNVIPPVLVMQGHSAPLDVEFYTGRSFPADVVGDALITFHGSWNRTTATGYKVVRVPFGSDGMPSGGPVPLLESANPGDTDTEWPHRPVGLGIGERGEVLVTSDASGVIIAIGHDGS